VNIFLLSFLIFLLAIIGIAIGTIAGRAPLKGSCGGNAVVKNCPACNDDDFINSERGKS